MNSESMSHLAPALYFLDGLCAPGVTWTSSNPDGESRMGVKVLLANADTDRQNTLLGTLLLGIKEQNGPSRLFFEASSAVNLSGMESGESSAEVIGLKLPRRSSRLGLEGDM